MNAHGIHGLMVEYHAHLQPHDSLQELFVLQARFFAAL